jgi:SAM-dependent methyltransferase
MKLKEIAGCLIMSIVSLIYDSLLFIYQSFIFGHRIWWWRLNLYYALEYLLGVHRVANRESKTLSLSPDNFICGETPCLTLRTIVENCECKPGDTFIDLGCGRGQTVFFARLMFNLKARGYELIPTFVTKARLINCFLKIDHVEFIHSTVLDADLQDAKIVYIVPTTFTEDFLEQVNRKLREAPAGAFIVSASRPLDEEHFELLKKDRLLYSWGKSAVYYYVRKKE